MIDQAVPKNPPLEDGELLRHLQEIHVDKHKNLSRSIKTKKFAKAYERMGQDFWDGIRSYVAGDPLDHALTEYLDIMRYPAAWEWARLKASEQEPVACDPSSVSLIARAHDNFTFLRRRGEMIDQSTGGPMYLIKYEKWRALTAMVNENPSVPSLEHPVALGH